mmetsp:Transcript_10994/g.36117  ORF Transcript_10994/g.36117 Transcript_10994/m.36117 type:complete len:330 (+) Transcript_10994:325-1314(+)
MRRRPPESRVRPELVLVEAGGEGADVAAPGPARGRERLSRERRVRERELREHEREEADARGPDVARAAEGCLRRLRKRELRREVSARAARAADELGRARGWGGDGEPKVGELGAREVVRAAQKDVLHLDVAVEDAFGVRVRERAQEPAHHHPCVRLRSLARPQVPRRRALGDVVRDGAARAQLHHQKRPRRLNIRGDVLHHAVVVAHLAPNLELLLHFTLRQAALRHLSVPAPPPRRAHPCETLDGVPLLRAPALRRAHGGKAAAAERAPDIVVAVDAYRLLPEPERLCRGRWHGSCCHGPRALNARRLERARNRRRRRRRHRSRRRRQ